MGLDTLHTKLRRKKMNRHISLTTIAILFLIFSTNPAHAGAARRHTIEGFILGTGVTLLGTAIIQNMNKPSVVYKDHGSTNRHRPARYDKKRHDRYGKKGHWKTREMWVPGEYETRWNPGHYNRKGQWKGGRHEEFMTAQGYWTKQRIWVRYNHRR